VRPDPLRELAVLLRAPEPGTTNLTSHVAEHAELIGEELQLPPKYLRALAGQDDEHVAPRLRRWLETAEASALESRRARRAERSLRAAALLGDSVRWTELGGELDVDTLLGDLLADKTRKYIVFNLPSSNVAIETRALAQVGWLRRIFIDLAAWVDEDGLHFRWRGGRGGFNWRPQIVASHQRHRVIEVSLRPSVRVPAAGRGAWLGEVLRDVGLLT
jgi:hypothetical protein